MPSGPVTKPFRKARHRLLSAGNPWRDPAAPTGPEGADWDGREDFDWEGLEARGRGTGDSSR
jgi:hypothetical protein